MIQATICRHAEDETSLDVDRMFEELINLKCDNSADTSESNITKWGSELESIMYIVKWMMMKSSEGLYEEGELLDNDWNENNSQSYESE